MLEFLPMIVILAGLGVMAYFMTSGKKKGHEQRAALAEQEGWQYRKADSGLVAGKADSERNLLYAVEGNTESGLQWVMNSRIHLKINKGPSTKLELYPGSEWRCQKATAEKIVILPNDGFSIPDNMISPLMQRLGLPSDMRRLSKDQLPPALDGLYDIFLAPESNHNLPSTAIDPLKSWRTNYPGAKKSPTIVAGADGVTIKTEWTLDKPAAMADFIKLGLSFINQ